MNAGREKRLLQGYCGVAVSRDSEFIHDTNHRIGNDSRFVTFAAVGVRIRSLMLPSLIRVSAKGAINLPTGGFVVPGEGVIVGGWRWWRRAEGWRVGGSDCIDLGNAFGETIA